MDDEHRLPPDEGRSWWLRDALAADPGEPCPPLSGDLTADVVVMGGGFTGMWTAWSMKELEPDAEIVLLEQDICGGGASGRNGGFCNSFWSDLPGLVDSFGPERALELCRVGEESVAAIGRFCEQHAIDAWFRAGGELEVASSEAQVGAWAEFVEAADRAGVGGQFQVLSASEVRRRVDSPTFRGGFATSLGATLQPARLARGIRRVLLERGVRIFESTPVTRFGAADPAVAETPGGTVRAGVAVIGLNAWAAAWKRFRRVLTVRGSYIVLTEPAPERLEAIGWTDSVAVSDFRAAVHYLRTTPDGRIAFGVGGLQPDLARSIDHRFAYDRGGVRVAIEDLHRMFPSFRGVPIEAGWGGPIDVSGDHLPTFGSLLPNVHYALGYTGNGVGPSHLAGRVLALRSFGRNDALLDLPLVDLEPKRFPPEPIRSPGALIANRAILRKERSEDRGEEPNPFVDFVARLPRRLGYNLGP